MIHALLIEQEFICNQNTFSTLHKIFILAITPILSLLRLACLAGTCSNVVDIGVKGDCAAVGLSLSPVKVCVQIEKTNQCCCDGTGEKIPEAVQPWSLCK